MTMTTIICLGRYGDIINILPLLEREWREGRQCRLMVAQEFSDILEGISYVTPSVWTGDWKDIRGAYNLAKSFSDEVKVWQIAGDREATLELAYKAAGLHSASNAESFAKEQWRVAGALHLWRENLRVNFDKRDTDREHDLWCDLRAKTQYSKQVLAYHLGGETSPYPYADLMRTVINDHFQPRHWQLIDLGAVRFNRLYDALFILERAKVLITVDSVFQHLAQGCDAPVAAICQDSPRLWDGSPWRPSHIAHLRYSDVHGIPDFLRRIDGLKKPGCRYLPRRSERRVIQVWSESDIVDKVQHAEAKRSWGAIRRAGDWVHLAIQDGFFGRNAATVFQDKDDPRRFPFVRDVLRCACALAGDDDWILLTRAQAAIDVEALGALMDGGKPFVGRQVVVEDGKRRLLAGSDTFGFTKAWWVKNQEEYPDMVMGHDAFWYRILTDMILSLGGVSSETLCSRAGITLLPSKESTWKSANAAFAQDWIKRHGEPADIPSFHAQTKSVIVNPASLFPWGYNPTITNFQNGYLMAYRSHRHNDLRTNLAVAKLDAQCNVKTNDWVEAEDTLSYEDPRFFWFQGQLWLSYIQSRWPQSLDCTVKVGQLALIKGRYRIVNSHVIELPWAPKAMEKNWVLWEQDGQLYCIYEQHPEQVVLKIEDFKATEVFRSKGVEWNWGAARGGTPPLALDGHLVRLFHSRTDPDYPPQTWRYHMGACTMDAKPPFTIRKVSKEPIATASTQNEREIARCAHYKAKIVFPAGWAVREEGWIASVGVNDHSCQLITMKAEDLKL
jgi:predicted GH43/DUF377 family glycosyl hydrolase